MTVPLNAAADFAARGKLALGYCPACERHHYYPRMHCPFCFAAGIEWRAAAGRGTIYSFSILRRTDRPYAIAYVTLDEQITLLADIVDTPLDAIRIGAAVDVLFKPAPDGPPVPHFVQRQDT